MKHVMVIAGLLAGLAGQERGVRGEPGEKAGETPKETSKKDSVVKRRILGDLEKFEHAMALFAQGWAADEFAGWVERSEARFERLHLKLFPRLAEMDHPGFWSKGMRRIAPDILLSIRVRLAFLRAKTVDEFLKAAAPLFEQDKAHFKTLKTISREGLEDKSDFETEQARLLTDIDVLGWSLNHSPEFGDDPEATELQWSDEWLKWSGYSSCGGSYYGGVRGERSISESNPAPLPDPIPPAGLYLRAATAEELKAARLEGGVTVLKVEGESLATKAGIKAGDLLCKVEGKAVTSEKEALSMLREGFKKKGKHPTIALVVIREGKEHACPITIPEEEREEE